MLSPDDSSDNMQIERATTPLSTPPGPIHPIPTAPPRSSHLMGVGHLSSLLSTSQGAKSFFPRASQKSNHWTASRVFHADRICHIILCSGPSKSSIEGRLSCDSVGKDTRTCSNNCGAHLSMVNTVRTITSTQILLCSSRLFLPVVLTENNCQRHFGRVTQECVIPRCCKIMASLSSTSTFV